MNETKTSRGRMGEMLGALIDGFMCAVTLRDLRLAAKWAYLKVTRLPPQ